jgi:hypothetical protein
MGCTPMSTKEFFRCIVARPALIRIARILIAIITVAFVCALAGSLIQHQFMLSTVYTFDLFGCWYAIRSLFWSEKDTK